MDPIDEVINIPFDTNDLTPLVKAIVDVYSETIGCPPQFILFSILPMCAHFMGKNTRAMVKPDTVVLTDKGQKKSPALKKIISCVKMIEDEYNEEDEEMETRDRPLQMYIDHFSMEDLHFALKRNGG